MGLILLRHTTPDVAPGTCYGQTDLDVAASFRLEANQTAASLPKFDAIVASPLIRCRKLATFLAEMAGLEIQTDRRLIEMDFGAWEDCLWADIPRSELDVWAADFLHARPHGGESVAMLRARVDEALSDIRVRGERTLIVTHAGVIRAALSTGDTVNDFNFQIDFGDFVTLPHP